MILGSLLLVTGLLAVALLVYPGELSQISSTSHRWLYDRSAERYERKWRSHAYTEPSHVKRIAQHAVACCSDSHTHRVLDVGCGTGRGVRIVAPSLAQDTTFLCVDFSARMLDRFRAWLSSSSTPSLSKRVTMVERSLTAWAGDHDEGCEERFGLVLLLEVGEFLPDLTFVLGRATALTNARGGLVMTRPAGPWHWAFPGRLQSRGRLAELLRSLGYGEIRFSPWRSRYELVFARKL
jgi:SAM-dependent methyltransferase